MGTKNSKNADSASSFESNASNMELLRKKIKGSVADNNQIETLVKFFSDPDAIQKKFVDPDYIKQQLVRLFFLWEIFFFFIYMMILYKQNAILITLKTV